MKKPPSPRQVEVIKKRFPEATLRDIQEAFGEKSPKEGMALTVKPSPPSRRLFLPSASKTDLLLACQWPFGRYLPPEEVGEPARFGSAFHERIAPKLVGKPGPSYQTLAKKWGVAAKKIKERVEGTLPVLVSWLEGENPWGVNFRAWRVEVEKAFALDPNDESSSWGPGAPARECNLPTEDTHEYKDRQPGEIPGTVDWFAVHSPDGTVERGRGNFPSRLLILDHKSGYDVPPAGASGQLRTLGLTLAELYKKDKVTVGFVHAPAEQTASILTETLHRRELEAHRRDLQRALGRVGDGSLTPGEHCKHCPAFMVCPANTTSLVELKHRGELTKDKVGEIHQALGEYDRMADRLRELVRAFVEANGPAGPRPDGAWVDLVKRPWTNLSQASIRRALPPKKAEQVIDMLEKLGCIEHTERTELRKVED